MMKLSRRFEMFSAFLSSLFAVSPAWGKPPRVTLDSGVVNLTVDLPDPVDGVYRGTRFDWSGMIEQLHYAGHDFYGRWFTNTDPTVHDFIFSGNEIVAGPCSAATGPADEFISGETVPGYDQAAAGGTFVKIGVGVLRKPDDQPYDRYHLYTIVDGGKWTVRAHRQSVLFRQELADPSSGYGYVYEKTIRLVPGKAEMTIEHTLRNTGQHTIDTDVYNHNFLVLDHRTTGPDFVITEPFEIQTPKPVDAALGMVEGKRILYRRELTGKEVFTTPISGFGATAKDYDIHIENTQAGVGMHITADQPLAQEQLWSIRAVLAVEPYIHMSIAPGSSFRWSYHYRYYSLPQR